VTAPGEWIAATPYGHLDPTAREYVITRPDTPTPWLNYLGQGAFGGIISNTAGGFSFDRDPRERRATRYRYNAIPADQPGRYVYLRDQETGLFWSPTWQPVRADLGVYECRHGPGYTRIRGALAGIQTEILYFVPPADSAGTCPCELWVARIRNTGAGVRRLRTFSYAEFGYVDSPSDQQNLDWSQHIVSSRLEGGVVLASTRFRPTTTFLGSSEAPVGWTGDRDDFVGRYGDLAAPAVVVRGEPSNAGAPRGNAIGSLCHDLVLAPGEERRLVFVLGLTDNPAEIPAVVARYADVAEVEAAFGELRADWDAYLGRFGVATPDADTTEMLNTWNQVQCRTTLNWSRFVSGYETGLGRGMGTRDSAQDTLGTMHSLPAEARRTLSRTWALQFRDGHAWHQLYPLSGEGGPGLAAEFPGWPQWFSDDHLWLVLATCAYLRETGDLAYLQERVPWADPAGSVDTGDQASAPAGDEVPGAGVAAAAGRDETVWGHMLQAMQFTLDHRGPHGLPRLGFADWDDTLNADHGSGLAESVWTALLVCRVALDLAEVCRHTGHAAEAVRLRDLHAEMAALVNATAWDGAWYARAFDDDGLPIGVASEERHRINLNPQAWSVIGEVAPPERAGRALRSVEEHLATPFGTALLWPPYDGGEDRVRGTSTYPPGAKENGGIFCHANAWLVVAAAMLGRGDEAYLHYRRFLPLARTDADVFRAEPYVYSQNICGPAHPQFGMARNAWLTGTAAWTFVAATQWILGIRPTFDGLRVAPVIPESWPGYEAHREFRGVDYEIRVRREGPGNTASLVVDGRPIAGTIVPLPAAGTAQVRVEVALG
jgi:cellobiose phosphorylase